MGHCFSILNSILLFARYMHALHVDASRGRDLKHSILNRTDRSRIPRCNELSETCSFKSLPHFEAPSSSGEPRFRQLIFVCETSIRTAERDSAPDGKTLCTPLVEISRNRPPGQLSERAVSRSASAGGAADFGCRVNDLRNAPWNSTREHHQEEWNSRERSQGPCAGSAKEARPLSLAPKYPT